jgi:signal transduction histidine kinase
MPEPSLAAEGPPGSILGWLNRSLAQPDPSHGDILSRERASRVSTTLLLLALLWVAGALLLPATTSTSLGKSPLGLTLILVSVPISLFLAYVVSRTRYTWFAAGFGAGVAAVGTIVAASYNPELGPAASSFFLFAVLLTTGSLFLPFPAALLIGALNLASAWSIPRWLPQAGPTALQVPYVFLGLNAALFMVLAPLRQHDANSRMAEAERAQEANRTVRVQAAQAQALRLESQSKDDLLRAATHEVRTPMSIILLQLSVLRGSGGALSAEQEKAVEVLERNLKRVADLMDHLLDKARIDAGRLDLDLQPVDVGAMLRDVEDSFRGTAEQWGVALRFEPCEATIRADPLRMAQMLYNLVGNALKFTPSGGTVAVAARREGRFLSIAVLDTGPGLTAEQIAGLGKPFHQVHEAPRGRWKGAGLGLSITRALAERHGGTLVCESGGPGLGSCFTVRLPVAGPTAPADAPADAPAAQMVPQG